MALPSEIFNKVSIKGQISEKNICCRLAMSIIWQMSLGLSLFCNLMNYPRLTARTKPKVKN